MLLSLLQRASIPAPPNDRSCWIPGSVDLIFVFLQPNQPPAANTHNEESQEAPQHHTDDKSSLATTSQGHENSAPCGHDQDDGENEMAPPGASSEFAAKDGKEAKDFNGEEREREDVSSRRKARS